MSTTAEVRLWGRTIGAVSLDDKSNTADFEYSKSFIPSGIQIAPLTMPLSSKIFSFPSLSRETFHGLPGFLADSLPDKYGNALIDAWLAKEGRLPESFNAIERLCYTGTRGMGALEYHPASGPKAHKSKDLQVSRLVELASEILSQRGDMAVSFAEAKKEQGLREILQVGTSAGGARAKAIIAWNPITNEVRSGQVQADPGFEYWLIKFDGVNNNKDKELADPMGFGAIEFAYFNMARDAGIKINDCRLLEEDGRRHFMTRRFDRDLAGRKLHVQTLGAISHFDYNSPGAHSYEEAFLVMRRLGLPPLQQEQLFRTMVFNIIARNQDDHVKNISFLMDQEGVWSLSPAYDLTYSYRASGRWTGSHQMTMNGKQDHFTVEDFDMCSKAAMLKRGRARQIIRDVDDVISRWPDYADNVQVDPVRRDQIQSVLRVGKFL